MHRPHLPHNDLFPSHPLGCRWLLCCPLHLCSPCQRHLSFCPYHVRPAGSQRRECRAACRQRRPRRDRHLPKPVLEITGEGGIARRGGARVSVVPVVVPVVVSVVPVVHVPVVPVVPVVVPVVSVVPGVLGAAGW